MFHLMLQRILHKKWMVASLLIGNILLIAIAVSHPMYQNAARNRMLTDGFTVYLEKNNRYPMVIETSGKIRKAAGYEETVRVRNLATSLCDRFGLPAKEQVCFRNTVVSTAVASTLHDGSGNEQKISIGSLSGLKDHARMLSGRMFEPGVTEDGYFEAVISQSAMVRFNLLVGEELDFINLLRDNGAGEIVRVRIVGVYTNSSDDDLFWYRNPDYFDQYLMIDEALFESEFLFETANKYQVNEEWIILPDYTQLRPEMAEDILVYSTDMIGAYKSVYSAVTVPDYLSLLENYITVEKQISVTLTILQVPVVVLLCAFIFMISRQMLGMEENEIALLKSRGASRHQVIRLYFLQSLFLSVVSFVIGLPLGSLICRILGSASAFLKFVQRRNLVIEYDGEVLLYGLAAVAVSTLMTLLPVFRKDKTSIVAVKRRRSRREKPLWQKLYLDVVILAVSLYGLYNFSLQQDEMLVRVLSGKSLDPLLFLSSSLFILGAGMLALRVHGLIIRLIYRIGRKKWAPAEYTSFLQLIRTGNKQAFIMVFLVLTVAFGMFNTTVARTIVANAENNTTYTIGADIVLQEYWKNNASYAAANPDVEVSYTEPDFGKYGTAGAKAVAKVFVNERATAKLGTKDYSTTVMGIDTKSFGETTDLADGLLKYDFREYLNVMSRNPDAVLLSANYRDKLGLKVGDSITYTVDGVYYKGSAEAVIYGFVDYWPSYSPSSVVINADGTSRIEDNFLIVANLSTIQEKIGVFPYRIWLNMDGDTSAFYDFLEAEKIQVTMLTDATEERAAISSEPLFQGTNGILTMSFITILLICSIGYVIYWTLSIRSRELLFGIFRAMGMSKGEVVRMLVNEQVFTGLFGIVFGLGIGWIASVLYVPIIQIAYSAADRVLPLELITRSSDIIRLMVIIGIVFIVCLAILIRQVFSMKISQALKLGED